jgi:hypothetical protein
MSDSFRITRLSIKISVVDGFADGSVLTRSARFADPRSRVNEPKTILLQSLGH